MSSPAAGPILLLGGSGMLGRAWRELLTVHGIAFTAPSHAEFDLTAPPPLDRRFRVVVNCAAYTNVDGCETEETLATRINATGPGQLAQRCREIGAVLIHYSSDYVFDGNAQTPYPTDAPRRPVSAYGRGKALAEELIVESNCDYLILRTSWLYAPWGKNFVLTIRDLARKLPVLNVVNDQRGRPTESRHLAAASLRLLEHDARGILHVTDGGQCSWWEFAGEIARLSHAPARILPCTTAQFPRPAPRPAYSVLDLTDTVNLLGPMPPWQHNLAQALADAAKP